MLTVIVLLLVGVVVGHRGWLPDGAPAVLDAIVVRIAFPGLILASVPDLALSSSVVVPVAVAWGTLVLLAGAVVALSRTVGLDRRTTGTLLLVVPLGNTSFLGFPAVEALLSPAHLPAAVLYDQLGSFLALATYGTLVAARFSGHEPPRARDALARVVAFPPFIALVVGSVLAGTIGIPTSLLGVAERVGAAVTPLAMLAVGLRLRLDAPGTRMGLLATALGLRLVLAPAAALAVSVAVGGGGIVWETSILEAAMPPMVTAAVLAADAHLDASLAARLVGIGVLASMATLPAWALLL